MRALIDTVVAKKIRPKCDRLRRNRDDGHGFASRA